MGRLNHDQEQFFYSFRLDEGVPADHPVRRIAAVLDLSWVYSELAPYYPKIGRPSIDPVLMIRMLIVGYAFGTRSSTASAEGLTGIAPSPRSCCEMEKGFKHQRDRPRPRQSRSA